MRMMKPWSRWFLSSIAKVWLLTAAALLTGMSGAAMAVTVSASPGTCASVTGIGTVAWTNPTRAMVASDNNYATASVDGTTTRYLKCTNYGFAIPAGSIINGITVNVQRKSSNTNNGGSDDAAMLLVKAGTIGATDRSTGTIYPTSESVEAHGSATDLWGDTWTAADINGTNFGAAFAATKASSSGSAQTVSVDWIQIVVDYTPIPTATSINTASTNPTAPATAVAWTVVFSASVTGVNAADFVLVQGGSVTGATITSVTGSGTTWTVNANTGSGTGTLGLNLVDDDTIINGSGTPLGGVGAGNGNFTGQAYTVPRPFCSPPSNIPVGVTVSCVCDQFARASLNPSTIFGSNWIVNTSGTTPYTPNIASSGYLRLTDTNGNESTSATVPGIFPAAGNYISIEFQQYAYNGSGADGMAVTLSDYSQTALPGAFGGSLGYAQKTGINGFNAGWAGVALDEYGNFENSGEGRYGGLSTSTLYPQSVGIRGSGSGSGNATANYPWLGGATTLSPGVSNSSSSTRAYGYYYQIVVDARNAGNSTPQTYIGVNRDTAGSGTYSTLIAPIEVFSKNPAQAVVPANWQLSFTGSTGGSTDIHELGNLRICAQNVLPPSGGTAGGFNAIDEWYGLPPSVADLKYVNGRIFTKLVGTPFTLDVAVMSATNQIVTTYAQTAAKNVTVNLVDNSDGVCVLDNTKPNYCSAACIAKTAVSGGSQTLNFVSGATNKGQKQTASFTLNSAYKNLAVIMSDGTATDCSTDSFSVRPTALTVTTNAGGTRVFKAGTDSFTLNVSATSTGYTGTPTIGSIDTSPMSTGTWVAGSLSVGTTLAAAVSGVSTNNSTYSEVGLFKLAGYGVGYDTSARGVFDSTWTAVDSVNSIGDCVAGSYSNAKDVNGKYGCNFGLVADATFGRFIPDSFIASVGSIVPRSDIASASTSTFTYLGEPFRLTGLTVTAKAGGGATTQNYAGAFGKLDLSSALANVANLAVGAQFGTAPGFTNFYNATSALNRLDAAYGGTSYTDTWPSTDPDCPGAKKLLWCKGKAVMDIDLTIRRPPSGQDGPFVGAVLGISPVDSDAVKMNSLDFQRNYTGTGALAADGKIIATMTGNALRFGRLRLQNAYGSERLPLQVPIEAQYWQGNYFVSNTDDSSTPLTVPAVTTLATGVPPGGVPSLYFYPPTSRNLLSSGNTSVSLLTSSLTGGTDRLVFTAPLAHPGWLDIILQVPGYLQYNWGNCNGQLDSPVVVPPTPLPLNDFPCARATFGTYKSPLIYRRENY